MSKQLIHLSKDVNEICEPHFNKLDIDHLNYIHRSNDGKVTYLCSNHQWLEHYLNKSYQSVGAFENNPIFHDYKYILWNGLDKNDPILIDSKEMIGIEHGITIIKHEQDGIGFYNIGRKTTSPAVVNEYINNIAVYENFIRQFQESANQLIQTSKSHKIQVKNDHIIESSKTGLTLGTLYLTQRECECIHYLAIGKTAEEISIILGISKRTVETHIENIKIKLDCRNQFRLGYLLGQMGINITKIIRNNPT